MTLTTHMTSRISVIVPTLDEEERLADLLCALKPLPSVEIIIADGGSRDRTLEIASQQGVRFVTSRPGRGTQLNAGARSTAGDILLFLHCDTRLPDNFPMLINQVLQQPDTVAGAFRLGIDGEGCGYRIIEWGANLRSRLLGLPYGDQALFVCRKVFDQVGGFPEVPLLEDLELIRRLKRLGRVRIAPVHVTTSARRWQRLGLFRTTLINQFILAAYLCGARPHRLSRLYYGMTGGQDKAGQQSPTP